MSDIANAIMDDLWANGFVPGDKVLQILAKHITPLEQEVERLRAALFCKRCDGTGQWFYGMADTWLDCDECEANAIRREAARAAGGGDGDVS